MKQFVPMSDDDWIEALSAGLVPVPYRPGVRCFHALRDVDDAPVLRREPAPAVVPEPVGVFD